MRQVLSPAQNIFVLEIKKHISKASLIFKSIKIQHSSMPDSRNYVQNINKKTKLMKRKIEKEGG